MRNIIIMEMKFIIILIMNLGGEIMLENDNVVELLVGMMLISEL